MAFPKASIPMISAAVLICGSMGYCQLAPPPAAAQQQGNRTTGTASPNGPSQTPGVSAPNDFTDYEYFMEFLGRQDDMLQAGSQNGSSEPLEKIDFSSAIGISQSEADTAVSVLLDAYHRRVSNSKEVKGSRMDVVTAMDQKNFLILLDAWQKLKETLPPDSYKKLDAYVSAEWSSPYSRSYRASHPPLPITPFPVEVRYQFFLDHIASEEATYQKYLAAGSKVDPRQSLSQQANFPPYEEERVRGILMDTRRQLQDNQQQMDAALAAMVKEYGFEQAARMPPSHEATELYAAHEKIMQDMKDRLKMELGDENFNNLDAWINKTYYGGRVINPSAKPQPSGGGWPPS